MVNRLFTSIRAGTFLVAFALILLGAAFWRLLGSEREDLQIVGIVVLAIGLATLASAALSPAAGPAARASIRRPRISGHRSPDVPLLTERTFEEFYQRTLGPLWTYVYRVIGNAADADDVVPEAFCRVVSADISALSLEEQRRYVFRVGSHVVVDAGDEQNANARGSCSLRRKELSCPKRRPMTSSECSRG